MPSSNDYLEYVLDLLRYVPNVHYKRMMGEFLLYAGDTLFGGIYDNRFLIKKSPAVEGRGFREEIPYPGAKTMLLVDIEDPFEVEAIIVGLCDSLR